MYICIWLLYPFALIYNSCTKILIWATTHVSLHQKPHLGYIYIFSIDFFDGKSNKTHSLTAGRFSALSYPRTTSPKQKQTSWKLARIKRKWRRYVQPSENCGDCGTANCGMPRRHVSQDMSERFVVCLWMPSDCASKLNSGQAKYHFD